MFIINAGSSDIFTLINIIVTASSMVAVGVITYKAATNVYKKQKKDQNSSYQDYLHMILRETGQEYLIIKETVQRISQLEGDLSDCHNVIYAIGVVCKMLVTVKKINPNPTFKNFDTYNYIFAKEEELRFRTKEICDLERLEKELEILHYHIKELCRKIDNLYKAKIDYGQIFDPPESAIMIIKKIDSGEMLDNQIEDSDVTGINLVYNKYQEIKAIITDIQKGLTELEKMLNSSQSITASVRNKYFNNTQDNSYRPVKMEDY